MEQQLCLFRGQNEAIFKNKQQRKNTSKSVHLKYIKKKRNFPLTLIHHIAKENKLEFLLT